MGAGSSAQNAAQRQEMARQANVTRNVNNVNSIFDAPERQTQYDDYLKAVRSQYIDDANQQKTVADRNLKFSLARSGTIGGSADTDARTTLGKDYTQGILTAEGKAQGALSSLKSQDEQQRQNLIQLATAGADTTTAATRAGEMMRASAQGGQNAALANGLGDVFGSTADIYKTQQENYWRRKGLESTNGGLYGSGFSGGYGKQ